MTRRSAWRERRTKCIVACATGTLFWAFPYRADAIVRRDDVPDSSYIALGNMSQYAAVGALYGTPPASAGQLIGSSILITPKWVLSAGHQATPSIATPTSFNIGGSLSTNGVYYNVATFTTNWTGSTIDGTDIGLIQLTTSVTGVTPASRYFGSGDIGTTVLGTSIGFGDTGTGLTGDLGTGTAGTKRGETNFIDEAGGDANLAGVSNKIMVSDFDDPANLDGLNAYGQIAPTNLEGMPGVLDSGGGVFIDDGSGRTFLAGVHSFIGAYPSNASHMGDGAADSSYSDIYGSSRVNQFNETLIDNTIPNNWNTGTNALFSAAGNWNGAFATGAPGVGDIAGFNLPGTYTVTFGGSVTNWQLLARQGTITFDLGGSTYTLNSTLYDGAVVVGRYSGNVVSTTFTHGTLASNSGVIGQLPGSTGQVNIAATGTWNVSGDLYVGGSVIGAGGTGTLNIQNTTSTVNVTGNLAVFAGGTVNFSAGTLSAGTLTVDGGHVNLSAGGNKVLRAQVVNVINNGKIDLSDNDMIVRPASGSQLANVQSLITTGYNGGNWLGNGITSSKAATSPNGGEGGKTALGYGAAGLLNITNFDGFAVNSTDTLIKYTYFGDANLDGKVDLLDLYALATHWLTTSQTWTAGDFNYDGSVNAKDLGLLAKNWQVGVGSGALSEPLDALTASFGLPIPIIPTTVPEPTSAAAILLLASAMPLRRRRNR